MKFLVFFVLCFVALTAAAPQLIWPGVVAPGLGGTIVAGPTVVNEGLTRVIAPGLGLW